MKRKDMKFALVRDSIELAWGVRKMDLFALQGVLGGTICRRVTYLV